MLRHVVLLSWTPDATEEQKQAVASELGKLPAVIDAIRVYRFGPDAGINPANCDFAVVADFDDAEGYVAYRDHPVHRKVIDDTINPIVAGRSAIQYRI